MFSLSSEPPARPQTFCSVNPPHQNQNEPKFRSSPPRVLVSSSPKQNRNGPRRQLKRSKLLLAFKLSGPQLTQAKRKRIGIAVRAPERPPYFKRSHPQLTEAKPRNTEPSHPASPCPLPRGSRLPRAGELEPALGRHTPVTPELLRASGCRPFRFLKTPLSIIVYHGARGQATLLRESD